MHNPDWENYEWADPNVEEVDPEELVNLLGLVDTLVQYVADVNAIDESGQSPLFRCIDSRFTKIAKFLLQHGASVNVIDDNGQTPLFPCIRILPIVTALCLAGADVKFEDQAGRTPLHESVRVGVVTQFLISNGADVDAVDIVGFTPIYHAVRCGNLESTKILFNSGANLSFRDYMGNTLLHTALRRL